MYFKFRPPECINQIHFPIGKDTEVENQRIMSTSIIVYTYTKNEEKNISKKYCKINAFIPIRPKSKKKNI